MVRENREESKAITKARLIVAAAKVFAREGFGGASIDRIVEEAGFSKGAFYSNFCSKKEIFVQLLESVSLMHHQDLQGLLSKCGDDPSEIVDAICGWATENSQQMEMNALLGELGRYSKLDPDLYQRLSTFYQQQQVKLGSLVLKIIPKDDVSVTSLELGALVAKLTFGNAIYFENGPSAGDLIRRYLLAIIKSSKVQ